MANSETVTAAGISGTNYEFFVHPIGTTYKPISGVYIFLNQTAQGQWNALYVGETSDLNQRLNAALQGHNAWPRISKHRATHIATRAVSGGLDARLKIETDLRHGLNPPCNDQ
ncbi:GIY-YIG nuclease family protein [Novosphingobium sp. ZN18A2]|uniref:GIY-YIG nuclease family protein n=1 Tax=Novosphingobium sp. ZN18A2 TaxID=3079861 RepID=UPI0030CC0062